MNGESPDRVRGVMVVNGPTRDHLTDRQLADYHAHKTQFIQWLDTVGKDPKHAEGYAQDTVDQTANAADRFYRWVWGEEENYTTAVNPAKAAAYMDYLVTTEEDYSNNYLSNTQKALKRLYRWRVAEKGAEEEWEPTYSFGGSASTNAKDYLTIEERRKVREAALEYGSVPARSGLDAQERDYWEGHLAQRFEKSKDEVTPEDWTRANGWKVPSLVWTSLDTGLRPVEVKRAKVGWVDVENRVLRIPMEESSKNADHWIVSLTERTAEALSRWISEREMYDNYADTDSLWLTRQGNPYGSSALKYVLTRLCEIAEIPTVNRKMSWYAIRHSVGTYMTRQQDLAAAQSQLRHKSPETTMRYDQTPVEDRRKALDKMG